MAGNVYRKRLAEVRAQMKRKKLDALIVPSSDPHLGEYVPDHWRIIRWLTGFTGSAGTVVITGSFAGLWTDSRYFIQAEGQLTGSGYELVKLKIPHTPEHIDWLRDRSLKGWKVGVDGRLISVVQLRLLATAMSEAGAVLNLKADLITPLWKDRPLLPAGEAFELDVKYAGIPRREKLEKVRQAMAAMKIDFQLLTAVDDIMWLLNIRGNDVKYCPLLLSYALVGRDQVLIFADEEKIPAGLKASLDTGWGYPCCPMTQFPMCWAIVEEGSVLMLTPGTTSADLWRSIARKVKVVEDISIQPG